MNIVTNRFLVDESTKILDKKVHYFVVSFYGYACDDDMGTAIKKSREWIPADSILSTELLVYLIPGRNSETSYFIRHSMLPPCISKENHKLVKGAHLLARLQPPQVDELQVSDLLKKCKLKFEELYKVKKNSRSKESIENLISDIHLYASKIKSKVKHYETINEEALNYIANSEGLANERLK